MINKDQIQEIIAEANDEIKKFGRTSQKVSKDMINALEQLKNCNIQRVVFSEERAEVCPYCGSKGTIKNDRKHKLCTNCSKGWQT